MKHITQTDLNGVPLVAGQATNEALIWDGANWVNGLPGTSSTLEDVLGNGNSTGANDISVNSGQRVVYNNSGFTANILEPTLGGNIDITLPSTTGTLALTSDITADWKLDGNTVGALKWLGTIDNYALPFRTNNTEVARFDTSGNFGVGLSTLTARFHAQGSGSTSATYTSIFQNSSGTQALLVRDDTKVFVNGVPAGSYDSSDKLIVNGTIVARNGNSALYLYNDGTNAGLFRYNYSGAVYETIAIGNTTTTLNLLGKIRISDSFTSTSDKCSISQSGSNGALIFIGGDHATNNGMYFYKSDAATLNMRIKDNGTVTMPLLQVGNVGLSSGDLYVDTAANVLANGDYVVARKV